MGFLGIDSRAISLLGSWLRDVAEWKSVQSNVYHLFRGLYEFRRVRYVYLVGVGLAFLFAARYIVGLHKGIPPGGRFAIAVLCGAIALMLAFVPVALVGYHIGRGRSVTGALGWVVSRVARSTSNVNPFADIGSSIDEIIKVLHAAPEGSDVTILTPNGAYFLTDQWLPRLTEGQVPPDLRRALQDVSDRAKTYRDALERCRASLCFVLPDALDYAVREWLRSRVEALGLKTRGVSEEFFVNLNLEAAGWIQHDLRRIRERRPTHLRLTTRAPDFRCLWAGADGVAFLQLVPERAAGILQPAIQITAQSHADACAAIGACLMTMKEVL